MEKPAGVFVDNLLDDGPAGQAGLQPEDIILLIDKVEVNQANQVQSLIAQKEPGDEVVVSVYRKGEYLDIPVVLEERETGSTQVRFTHVDEEEPAGLGLGVRTLTRRDARELGLNSSKGVLVTKVVRFSKANYAGLFPNLVILKVNDKNVDSEDKFWEEMDKLKSGDVGRLFVRRPNAPPSSQTQHFFIEIP